MELKKILNKKIERKSFFITLGIGAGSYLITKMLPFRFLRKRISKSKSLSENKIKVKINPSAVSRTKIGGMYGGR